MSISVRCAGLACSGAPASLAALPPRTTISLPIQPAKRQELDHAKQVQALSLHVPGHHLGIIDLSRTTAPHMPEQWRCAA